MDPPGGGVCAHLHACSSDEIKDLQARYRRVVNWAVREDMDPTPGGSPLPRCHHCHQTTHHAAVCLRCDAVSCRKTISVRRVRAAGDSSRMPGRPQGKNRSKVVVDHPGLHAKASGHMFCTSSGRVIFSADSRHGAAVDGVTGAIYCHQCEDFVYAEIIDTWRNRALRTMEERLDISLDGTSLPSFQARCSSRVENGKRAKFKVWKPLPEEKTLIERSEPIRCHCTSPLFSRVTTLLTLPQPSAHY